MLLDSFGLELLSLDDVLKIEETEDSESEISEIQDNKDGDQVDDTERTEKGQPDGSQKPESNIDKIAEFVSVDGQRPANEKKKPGWIWFLLVLTPVIAAGVFVVINGGNINILTRKSTENLTIKNETISNYNDLTAQDTIQDDSISLMPADSLEIVDTDTIQNSISDQDSTGSSLNSAPKYYLIAGSFKEEENAEKFLAQFNVEGFEPFHLGKIRNFYYIAAGTYETEEKALAAKKEFMEKKPESEIWIYWE